MSLQSAAARKAIHFVELFLYPRGCSAKAKECFGLSGLAIAAAICQRTAFPKASGKTLMAASRNQVRKEGRAARGSGGGPLWMFLRGFIKHPVMVGSVIPSSKVLIDKMLAPVDWTNCKLFVEYGPGVGTFTEHVLQRMAPDATLIAIDTNPDFTQFLRRKFTDSRLSAVTGSAADVRQIIADAGFKKADYVLSGLPFSTLPPGIGPKIAEETAAALRQGGCFLVYQFSPKVRDFLVPYFERIERGFEWINIPPAQLFWCYRD
jgi:phospholipid N-methyltransferase